MDWFNLNNIWYPYTQMQNMDMPILVERTKGAKIILSDGTELIDGIASWWSSCHGYNHSHITNEVKKQLDKMPHVMFAGTAHEQPFKLANRLCELAKMDRVFFTDSGSTAVETAMKIAVQYWKNKGDKNRNKFISFSNGYHGDTMGAMSLCDPNKGMHKSFNNYMPKQYSIDIPIDEYQFAEFDDLLSQLRNVAAVIIEPLVQGAGGFKFHSADVLAEIYRITKKNNILFIADEIMTGFYRTGSVFACSEAGIVPDIKTLGKSLTAGYMTLAAILTKKDIFDEFLGDMDKALMSGPTFMANPLACAAANASLDLFDDVDVKIANIENYMTSKLSKYDLPVRVKGAIAVIELNVEWEVIFKMRQEFIKYGVWLRPFNNVLYVLPSFNISNQELDVIFDAIDKVLRKFNIIS